MPVAFEHRIEFGSDEWIACARDFLERAAGERDFGGVRFSLCETFVNAPPHLGRPGNIADWHVRIDGANITAAAGAINDADLRIRGDYHAVLPISRTVYGTDAAAVARAHRENAKRVGASAIEVRGTPPTGRVAHVLSAMHDHLARRTIDNPDLANRLERQNLSRNVRDLEDKGYTILEGAFSARFADELRATILERMAENRNPAAPAAMLLERGRIFEEAALHPWLVTLAEKLCGKGFLLAQLLGQRKGNGPGALGLHSDYNLIREPFPEYPQNCTSIWALEDFTLEAGPTLVVPGSHRKRRHPERAESAELAPIIMPKGSIALWDGATWHAQAARSLEGERVTLHATYSRMTLRTYDNYLRIAPEILDRNPPELTTMAGLDDLFEKNRYSGPDYTRLRYSIAIFRT